ncbi:MAG: SDR family oxidoreductase [Pseudomonadota bacterium]
MQNILITGATAGIGKAAAILLASKGHRVFGAGRDEGALEKLGAGHDNILPLKLDVTEDSSVKEALEYVSDVLEGATIDVLVNNAGIAKVGPVESVSMEDWELQYQTNVLGPLRVTKAVLPAMRERRRGRVVMVSSVAGRVTVPFFGPYNSSKHALESLSDALRMELRPHGVEVVLLEPGAVKTRFSSLEQEQFEAHAEASPPYASQIHTLKNFHRELHRNGADPVSVAGAVVAACEGNEPPPRRIVPLFPGAAFVAIKSLLPTRISDWVVRKLTKMP